VWYTTFQTVEVCEPVMLILVLDESYDLIISIIVFVLVNLVLVFVLEGLT